MGGTLDINYNLDYAVSVSASSTRVCTYEGVKALMGKSLEST